MSNSTVMMDNFFIFSEEQGVPRLRAIVVRLIVRSNRRVLSGPSFCVLCEPLACTVKGSRRTLRKTQRTQPLPKRNILKTCAGNGSPHKV